MELDSSQKAFCDLKNKNIRLLAPAGCGKTSSLLYRCRALAQRSELDQRFLLLSFTNAAAAEMRERLEDDNEFASIRKHVVISTLNAWGWTRLRRHNSNSRLLDENKKKNFAVVNQLKGVCGKYQRISQALQRRKNKLQPRDLMDVIDGIKSLRFDHIRHTSLVKFGEHVDFLVDNEVGHLLERQVQVLAKKDVIAAPEENDIWNLRNKRQFYNNFF